MKLRLLIFHQTIAPYRIDFFNSLYAAFETRICPFMDHMVSQTFDYKRLEKLFEFKPHYLLERYKFGKKEIPKGVFGQIREWKPDVVFVNEYGCVALLVLIYRWIHREKYKIVSICDDSYNMIYENNDFKLTHKIARKFFAPLLDDLLLVEPAVVDWYQQHYRKGYWFPIIKDDVKAIKMYNSLMPKSKKEIERFDLVGKNVFLFVGRLVKIKNVHTAIEAFSKLDQQKNVLVVI